MGNLLKNLHKRLSGNMKHYKARTIIGGHKIRFGILQKLIIGFIIPVALIVFLGIILQSFGGVNNQL